MRYNTKWVSKAIGCTLRELQYWDEIGLLCPSRKRNIREYTMRDIRRAQVIRKLRELRVTLPVILEVFGGVVMDTEFAVFEPACRREARFTKLADKTAVIEFLKGATGPSYLIALKPINER